MLPLTIHSCLCVKPINCILMFPSHSYTQRTNKETHKKKTNALFYIILIPVSVQLSFGREMSQFVKIRAEIKLYNSLLWNIYKFKYQSIKSSHCHTIFISVLRFVKIVSHVFISKIISIEFLVAHWGGKPISFFVRHLRNTREIKDGPTTRNDGRCAEN